MLDFGWGSGAEDAEGGAKWREEGAEAAMFNFEFWMMNVGAKRREGSGGRKMSQRVAAATKL
jgi:hypothetical protein